ncbi:hypothetical protein CF326_g6555 [Tilletia indica]|nr:hypothetical protein CF326_g6555 [Tilletia indica]
MSNLPRIIGQIIFNGSIILGRAFAEAGKQAIRNARSGEAAAAATASTHPSSSSDGRAAAGGGDPSHALTRLHRMTLQEALLILNLKAPADAPPRSLPPLFPRTESSQANLAKVYEHLFKTNAPPAPKGSSAAAAAAGSKATGASGGQGSFYVQSKIVRARERIEAEWEAYAPKDSSSSSTTAESSSESQSTPPSQPPPPPSQ